MKIDKFLTESPIFAITRTARTVEVNLGRSIRDEGLGFSQALVLIAILLEDPNPVNPSRLAESFSTTRGNISHCLSVLESRGFIKRRINRDDARMLRVTIRSEGKQCAMRLICYFNALEKQIENTIGTKTIQNMLNSLGEIEQLSRTNQKS